MPFSQHKEKSKTRRTRKVSTEESTVGSVVEELEVPLASEVIFRKIWHIRNYNKTIQKRDIVDGPAFRCSVNGMTTFWTVSIRFWKGPKGKKVKNPVVVCLNLTGCNMEEVGQGQARIRFQFGVWDATIKHWDFCSMSNIVLNLQNTQEMLSIGYKNLEILERHINEAKEVSIMVKIQIVQLEEETHSLSQDMARIFAKTNPEYMDTKVEFGPDLEPIVDEVVAEKSTDKDKDKDDESRQVIVKVENAECEVKKILVHSLLIKARSPMLAVMLVPYSEEANQFIKYKLDLKEINYSLLKELFRYIYTDKVENIETFAYKLLPLSVKFCISGLQSLCERVLLDSMTPNNVANILLLADEYKCESLRKGALHYCEESEEIKGNVSGSERNLAWRVMEMVNPDLFLEACESIGSSSSNIDSPSSYSD